MSPDPSQRGFNWPQALLLLVLLLVMFGLLQPLRLVQSRMGDRTKALANAKSMVGGLITFQGEHGAFPCHTTRAILEEDPDNPSSKCPELKRVGPCVLLQGESSNAYFAQLIVTGIFSSEKKLYPSHTCPSTQDNDAILSPEEFLNPGVNPFAYLMAPNGDPLTDTRSFTPLILGPAIAQVDEEPSFDPKPYDGKLVAGLVDGSSKVFDIDEQGHAISPGRDSFFQSGPDSLFGKDTPVVKYPLFSK